MFSWDEAKNQGNQRKHGISFEIAKLVLDDPLHISRQDRDEDGELRWQTIGRAGDLIVLLVAHILYQTKTGEEHIRIISARAPPSWRGKSMSKVPESVREELAALAARPESEIDYSDIPATTEKDWLNAERGRFYKPIKRRLTVSLDDDVLEWLKGQGDDYRTRVNEVLRNAMLNDTQQAG